MRHTDGLLGIKPQHLDDIEKEQKEQYRQAVVSAKLKLEALQSLKHHPGWNIFRQHCQADKAKVMALLEVSQDPTSLAKLTGVLLAVTSFEQWAEQECESLAAQLEQNPI